MACWVGCGSENLPGIWKFGMDSFFFNPSWLMNVFLLPVSFYSLLFGGWMVRGLAQNRSAESGSKQIFRVCIRNGPYFHVWFKT